MVTVTNSFSEPQTRVLSEVLGYISERHCKPHYKTDKSLYEKMRRLVRANPRAEEVISYTLNPVEQHPQEPCTVEVPMRRGRKAGQTNRTTVQLQEAHKRVALAKLSKAEARLNRFRKATQKTLKKADRIIKKSKRFIETLPSLLLQQYPEGRIEGGSRRVLNWLKSMGYTDVNMADLTLGLQLGNWKRNNLMGWINPEIVAGLPDATFNALNPPTSSPRRVPVPTIAVDDFSNDYIEHGVYNDRVSSLMNVTRGLRVQVGTATVEECSRVMGPTSSISPLHGSIKKYVYDRYNLIFSGAGILIDVTKTS